MTTRYTKDHEWVSVDGDVATVGITTYAAESLGDVVFVDLPAVGKTVAQGGEMAVVESVKAASDVYAPISGVVSAVNDALADAPEGVNEGPETTGWFAKLTVSNPAELDALMDRAAYDAFVAGL
jgi:glycine cleavage system H protein